MTHETAPELSISVRLRTFAIASSMGDDTLYFLPWPGGGVAISATIEGGASTIVDSGGFASRPAAVSIPKRVVENLIAASDGIDDARVKIESVSGVPWLNVVRTAHHSYASHHVAEIKDPPADWLGFMKSETEAAA